VQAEKFLPETVEGVLNTYMPPSSGIALDGIDVTFSFILLRYLENRPMSLGNYLSDLENRPIGRLLPKTGTDRSPSWAVIPDTSRATTIYNNGKNHDGLRPYRALDTQLPS
jgi:hypothetical protein